VDCGWDGFVVLLTCFCFISDVGSKCLCDSKSSLCTVYVEGDGAV
jgi:hypothetical protein